MVKDGTVVVKSSDKGNNITISDMESYMRQGEVHTKADRVITDHDVIYIQKRLNNHSKALCNIFNIGISHGGNNQKKMLPGCLHPSRECTYNEVPSKGTQTYK